MINNLLFAGFGWTSIALTLNRIAVGATAQAAALWRLFVIETSFAPPTPRALLSLQSSVTLDQRRSALNLPISIGLTFRL